MVNLEKVESFAILELCFDNDINLTTLAFKVQKAIISFCELLLASKVLPIVSFSPGHQVGSDVTDVLERLMKENVLVLE